MKIETKLYSINDLIKWYSNNTDTEISDDFLIYLINKGILQHKDISLYSLSELNEILLEKINNEFIKNNNDKFIVKENRKNIINKYPKKKVRTPKRFKITTLEGNKLKLIKLN